MREKKSTVFNSYVREPLIFHETKQKLARNIKQLPYTLLHSFILKGFILKGQSKLEVRETSWQGHSSERLFFGGMYFLTGSSIRKIVLWWDVTPNWTWEHFPKIINLSESILMIITVWRVEPATLCVWNNVSIVTIWTFGIMTLLKNSFLFNLEYQPFGTTTNWEHNLNIFFFMNNDPSFGNNNPLA